MVVVDGNLYRIVIKLDLKLLAMRMAKYRDLIPCYPVVSNDFH
jgi:hypothetical protein